MKTHILTIVAFLPLAGAIVLMFFNKENKLMIRLWANAVALLGFLVSVPLFFLFNYEDSGSMQFTESLPGSKLLARSTPSGSTASACY